MLKRPSNIIFVILIIIGLLYAKLFYTNFAVFLFLTPIPVLFLFLSKYRYIFISIVIGMFLFNIHNMTFYYSDHTLEQFNSRMITISGTIKDHKNYRFNSISIIQAESFYVDDREINLPITVSTYSTKAYDYFRNDSIIISGKFQRFNKAKNYFEKDEIDLARNNKISGFILSPKIVYHKSKFSSASVIHKIRSKITEIFNEKLSFRSANFMNAILIGSRESLEKSTIKEFSESGTIHLLAVSGLHVGFLLLILTFFQKLFSYKINIHIVICSTVLISYILITGSSPSVIRAVIMSIVALLSFPLKRKIKVLDIIATAGIFSLIIDPNQIFKVGFVLSFTAVLSLVIIYRSIISEALINNLILKTGRSSFIIKGLVVSISASIGTLPVVLYYFGRFNVFSILANVVLIPITGLNYFLGIILITVNKINILSSFLAYVINTAVDIMLKIISFVSNLSVLKLIYKVNFVELIILISLVVIIFIIKSYRVKIGLLSIIIGIIISSIFLNPKRNHVYYFSTFYGNSSFATIDKQNILFLGKLKQTELKYIIKPYLLGNNIESLDYIILLDETPDLENKISELDIPISCIVSKKGDFNSEVYEVVDINSSNKAIVLFNGRIYFSDKNDKVILAYYNKRFLFGNEINLPQGSVQCIDSNIEIDGVDLDTVNGGIIVFIDEDEISYEQFGNG